MPAERTAANRADRGDDATTVAELRKLVEDFVAAWDKVMNLDRFDLS